MDKYTISSQEILDRISRHCPNALSAYLTCLNIVNDDGIAFFSRCFIENDLSLSFTKFRNQIKQLALENLLEWHEMNGGIAITLADIDE